MAEFLPKILLKTVRHKIPENCFLIIIYPYVKNELKRFNTSLSPRILHINIFELPVDFRPHISANALVVSVKLRKRVFSITVYLFVKFCLRLQITDIQYFETSD